MRFKQDSCPLFARCAIVVLTCSALSVSAMSPRAQAEQDLRASAPQVQGEGDKPKPKAPTLEQVRARMKARYATLKKLIRARLVGETWDGYVDVVKSEYAKRVVDPRAKAKQTIGAVVAAESADRRFVYAYLAKQLKTSAAKIGVQNGVRHLMRLQAEEYFRLKSGQWAPRKKIKRKKK